MATMLRTSVAQRSVAAARPTRASTVVVRASQNTSRRSLLGLVATVTAAASLAVAEQASAIGLPWQESTGGMVKGGGNSPKSATRASMESYTLEGTKKQGISAKSRKKMLAAARKKASEAAS